MAHAQSHLDPCHEFTSVQRNALIWFVVVLFLGLAVTIRFAVTDRWMYDNNAEFFDVAAQKENRAASQLIASERSDPRQAGDFVTAVSNLRSIE